MPEKTDTERIVAIQKKMDYQQKQLNQLEQDQGGTLAAIANAELEVQQLRVDFLALADRVGLPPQGNSKGSGIAGDLALLQASAVSTQKELHALTERVGEAPSERSSGTGMSRAIHRLEATIGVAPNEATGHEGSGIAKTVVELYRLAKESQEMQAKEAAKPLEFERKIRTVAAILSVIVFVGTISAAIGAALVWYLKHSLGAT